MLSECFDIRKKSGRRLKNWCTRYYILPFRGDLNRNCEEYSTQWNERIWQPPYTIMLWVKVSVTALEYTDYNTGSMKQIKERIRLNDWVKWVTETHKQECWMYVRHVLNKGMHNKWTWLVERKHALSIQKWPIQIKLFEEMCRHHTLPFRGDLKRTYGEYTPVVECKGMANVAHHYVLI